MKVSLRALPSTRGGMLSAGMGVSPTATILQMSGVVWLDTIDARTVKYL